MNTETKYYHKITLDSNAKHYYYSTVLNNLIDTIENNSAFENGSIQNDDSESYLLFGVWNNDIYKELMFFGYGDYTSIVLCYESDTNQPKTDKAILDFLNSITNGLIYGSYVIKNGRIIKVNKPDIVKPDIVI